MIRKSLSVLVLLCAALFSSAFAGELVQINTADAKVLEERLIGIGAVKAEAIVVYRQHHGPFDSIEQLLEVPGIGEKTLEKIRVEITTSVGDEVDN